MRWLGQKRRPTLKQMLDLLDQYYAIGDQDAKDLWDICGAIRGADSEDFGSRCGCTNPIRVKAFPRTANTGEVGSTFWTTIHIRWRPSLSKGGKHFLQHALDAWDALKRAR